MASWTLAPPKLLLFRWRLHGLVDDVAVTDGGLAFVPLVVLILHRHADADVVAVLEAESVVGVGARTAIPTRTPIRRGLH